MLLWGLAVFALASFGHGLDGIGYGGLLALRIVAGAAVGVAYSSASAALADAVPYARRGAAMGALNAGMLLAVPVGLPLAVWLAADGGWRTVFIIQGGLGIAAALAVAAAMPSVLRPASTAVRIGGVERIAAVLRRPMVLPALLAAGLNIGAFYAVIQFVGVWLDDTGLLGRGDQGALWIGVGLTGVLGAALLSRFGDRFGNKRFVIAMTLLQGALLGLMPLAGGATGGGLPWFLWTAVPMAVVASARTGPLGALLSELVSHDERGTIMGLRSAFQMAGMAVNTALMGPLMAAAGFAGAVWAAVALMVLSCLLMAVGVRRMG